MFAFACLALVNVAYAADGTETKFNGELRAHFFSNMNPSAAADTTADPAKQESHWEQRTKLGATFSKGESLNAHIGLIAANTWGNDYASVATRGSLTATGENFMFVHEAWGFWKPWSNFSFRLGRGALNVADGTVLSTNDGMQLPYAFDGVLGTYYAEFANINIFGVKGFDTYTFAAPTYSSTQADTPEINFYGVSLDVKNLPEALKMVNVHIMQINGTKIGGTNDNMNALRYGLTLAGNYMNFDYRGTYAGYSGKSNAGNTSTDSTGSMFDLGAGYSWTDMMNFHLGALYHSDSGDTNGADTKTETYDSFFYDKHNNAGMMDLVKWGNSTYFKVGASLEPMETTKFGVDYYSFSRTTNKDTAYWWATGFDANGALTNTDTAVGTEIDVYATKTYDNGVSMSLFYGMFTPGEYLKKQTGVSVDRKGVSQLGLEAKMVF